MNLDQFCQRYKNLQAYLDWNAADVGRIVKMRPLLEPEFPGIVVDFYDAISRNRDVQGVITGGPAQVARLRETLLRWIEQLFQGCYDDEYVRRRWQVGKRHAELRLDQIYTNAALSRIRVQLVRALCAAWTGSAEELRESILSLNRLLDLDLAIIEDAYHSEYVLREKQIERLALIGKMAGGIAHELRNPLNVIESSSYFLQNNASVSPAKFDEHLQRIVRQVATADRVITALSDFARLPLPEPRSLFVAALLEQALADQEIPQSVTVTSELDQSLSIRGDQPQLLIVLGNLIRNALDAMSRQGELAIRITRGDGYVSIHVKDSGPGIAHQDTLRIFDPFYSTKTRGIGLGLSISRSIVENHRGTLTLESTAPSGAEFVVRLPENGWSNK